MGTSVEDTLLASLNRFARSLDPSAKVLIKDDSTFMKILAIFMKVFCKTFMTTFATTICNRVYIPRSWLGRDLRCMLTHEVGGHVRQCRLCGLGIHPWVGFPIYMILYLLVFFPILGAWPRYRFELGADVQSWGWTLANGGTEDDVRARAKSFAQVVAGWNYLRPWPATLVWNGFVSKAEKVIKEYRARHG